MIYVFFFFFNFINFASEKEVHSSTEFHEPRNFLVMIFLGNYGVDFRDLGISLLKEYGAIMLVFIMVVVIYGIAFLGIKLGPQNAAYLFFFKMICDISAILACELLAYILVGPLRFVLDKFMWKSSRGAASLVQANLCAPLSPNNSRT